jgi:hypothetical protein
MIFPVKFSHMILFFFVTPVNGEDVLYSGPHTLELLSCLHQAHGFVSLHSNNTWSLKYAGISCTVVLKKMGLSSTPLNLFMLLFELVETCFL